MGIERYIAIHTFNQQWYNDIVATFEWIDSIPEGHEKLEEALALHGKPLLIIATPDVKAAGFSVLRPDQYEGGNEQGPLPFIRVNPDHIPLHRMKAENGSEIRNSLARTLSHELCHSTQPDVIAKGVTAIEKIYKFCQFEPSLDFLPSYEKRKSALRNDEQLQALLGEMYDEHISPQVTEHNKQALAMLKKDEDVRVYAKEFEKPAVEFENLMMAYKGEKPRSTDYLNSLMEEAIDEAGARAHFIEQNMAFLKAAHEERKGNPRAGKNPSEIRSDAPPKPTGETGRQ